MPRRGATFLLDENVPYEVTAWLSARLPEETTVHIYDLHLVGAKDPRVMEEGVRLGNAIVVSYDEDLADQRQFPIGTHGGVIRLRVDPTTVANTIAALDRLLSALTLADIARRLIIVDEVRIRSIGDAPPAGTQNDPPK